MTNTLTADEYHELRKLLKQEYLLGDASFTDTFTALRTVLNMDTTSAARIILAWRSEAQQRVEQLRSNLQARVNKLT